MGTFIQKLLDLIPEATYDLISRMLPGGLVVASLASYYPNAYGFSIDAKAEFLQITIFLVLSYGAGLVVSTLSHPLYWLTWPGIYLFLGKWTDVNTTLVETLNAALKRESKALDPWCPLNASVVLDRAHDFIKKQDPLQGLVVTKLSAEVSLVYGLAIASGLFAFLNCGQYWLLTIVLLIAGALRSVRVWQRHASILQAVTSKAVHAS